MSNTLRSKYLKQKLKHQTSDFLDIEIEPLTRLAHTWKTHRAFKRVWRRAISFAPVIIGGGRKWLEKRITPYRIGVLAEALTALSLAWSSLSTISLGLLLIGLQLMALASYSQSWFVMGVALAFITASALPVVGLPVVTWRSIERVDELTR